MDPTFALTFKEIQIKFKGKNKISKDATLLLTERDVFFENLDLGAATLVCKSGTKAPSLAITFEKCTDKDAEIY